MMKAPKTKWTQPSTSIKKEEAGVVAPSLQNINNAGIGGIGQSVGNYVKNLRSTIGPTDQLAGNTAPATWGTTAAPTPMSNTPVVPDNAFVPTQTRTSGIFGNVNSEIGQGYQTTLGDALSGKLYDPLASQTAEAQARMEANKRAGRAQQIASAGFSGQGIGQQVSNATEDALSRSRFDSNIGIETARNASRLGALGEARAFGTAEQNVAKEALDQAALYGSDSDFAAAYKNTYGTELDPMAIKEIRGTMRETAKTNLDTLKTNLATLKSTASGTALASMVLRNKDWETNPQLALNDPAFKKAVQNVWEASGQTGEVPADWAMNQVKAIADPRLNNEFIVQKGILDTAVKSGALTQDSADVISLLSQPANAGIMKKYVQKDAAGNVTGFDWDAARKDMVGENKGTTVNINNGSTAPTAVPKGKQIGDVFIGSDGKTYNVVDDGAGNPIVEYTPTTKADFSVKKGWLASNWDNPDVAEGAVVKATVNGKEQSLKITRVGKKDVKLGIDTPYIEFIGSDGNQYYVEEGGQIKGGTAPKSGTGDIVNAYDAYNNPVQTSNETVNTIGNIAARALPPAAKATLAFIDYINPWK